MVLPEDWLLRPIEQKIESRYKHAQLSFDKGTEQFSGDKIDFALKGAQAIEHLQATRKRKYKN